VNLPPPSLYFTWTVSIEKGEEGVEPMTGGVRGQAWPAPIGQGDMAKYSALDVIVLILFPFTPGGGESPMFGVGN
jgi:hypothetical protein